MRNLALNKFHSYKLVTVTDCSFCQSRSDLSDMDLPDFGLWLEQQTLMADGKAFTERTCCHHTAAAMIVGSRTPATLSRETRSRSSERGTSPRETTTDNLLNDKDQSRNAIMLPPTRSLIMQHITCVHESPSGPPNINFLTSPYQRCSVQSLENISLPLRYCHDMEERRQDLIELAVGMSGVFHQTQRQPQP